MTRQAAIDPAMPAVGIDQLQTVMDKDLAATLTTRELAAVTGRGVTIGVVAHSVRRIFTYGAAKPDSVYEIGSISKTFTGLILAQMVQQKKARLDEPVRALLPPGTVAAPGVGPRDHAGRLERATLGHAAHGRQHSAGRPERPLRREGALRLRR
jgi:CubicO group peptidase (beta-lactamase class C family)